MGSRWKSWKGSESRQQQLSSSQPILDESDSSSEIEDDDAEGVTPQIEKAFFKTLSFVKSKDPRIYDQHNKFYEDEDESLSSEGDKVEKKKPDKAMYLRDYERKIILEKGGQYSEDESDDDGGRDSDEDRQKREASPTYVQEQHQIRESFRAALESDESESEQGLLQTKTKTKQQKEEEENDYKQWLKGEADNTAEDKDMGALRNYWTDPELDKGEKFLRDYILNKDYVNKDDRESSSSESEEDDEEGGAMFSEDERILEEQDNFERKFNFRFEEPDTDFIKRYPRTVSGSVRRKDGSRTEKRKEKKDRKEKEKEKKRDELKHIKNVKKQEILDKLDQLKQATGNATVGFNPEELEEDFDPDKYDKMMQNIFNEDYEAQADDDMKPGFGDEYDEENYGAWDEEDEEYGDEEEDVDFEDEAYEPHCDDPDFIMDADYDPSVSKKSGKKKGESSKKKKNAGFADVVKNEKPTFDPEDKTFDEYMEEYYKLDYEDLIGDLPTRFKYRSVMPNSFGLSVEEVLSAKDKELNQWVSVKRTSQYRTKEEEIFDIRKFRKRSKNEQLKRRIFLSLMEEDNEEESQEESRDEDATSHDEGTDPHEGADKEIQEGQPAKDAKLTSPGGKKRRRKKKKRGDEQISSPYKDIASTSKETTSPDKEISPDKDIASPKSIGDVEVGEEVLAKKDTKKKHESELTDSSARNSAKGSDSVLSSDQIDERVDKEQAESKKPSRKRRRKKQKPQMEESLRQNLHKDNNDNEVSPQKVKKVKKDTQQDNEDGVDLKLDMKRTVAHSNSEDEDQELHDTKRKGGHVNRLSTQSGKVNAPFKVKSKPIPVDTNKRDSPFKGKFISPSQGSSTRQDKQSKHRKGPMWSSESGSSKSQNPGHFSPAGFKKGVQSLRHKQQNNSSQNQSASVNSKQPVKSVGNEGSGARKRRKRRSMGGGGGRRDGDPINAISDARLKAYGVNPKKIKYQLEYQKQKQNKI